MDTHIELVKMKLVDSGDGYLNIYFGAFYVSPFFFFLSPFLSCSLSLSFLSIKTHTGRDESVFYAKYDTTLGNLFVNVITIDAMWMLSRLPSRFGGAGNEFPSVF